VDTNILKPNTGYLTIIERPSHTASTSSSKGTSERQLSSGDGGTPHYAEPVSEGEEDDDVDLAPAKDEDKRTGLSGVAVAEAIAYREQMLKERRASDAATTDRSKGRIKDHAQSDQDQDSVDIDERTTLLKKKKANLADGKPRALSIDPLAPSSAFDETLRDRLRREHDARKQQLNTTQETEEGEAAEPESSGAGPSGSDGELVRHWTAPPGKRIAVPVRIEPKVYFAAERTFLVSLLTSNS
jgi:hypothetical protein